MLDAFRGGGYPSPHGAPPARAHAPRRGRRRRPRRVRSLRVMPAAVPTRSDPPRLPGPADRPPHLYRLPQVHRAVSRRRARDGRECLTTTFSSWAQAPRAAWPRRRPSAPRPSWMSSSSNAIPSSARRRAAPKASPARTRVVIGTDGVETMVGRWAGLDTRVPARDMESCAQYVLDGIDFDPDAIYLQFGDHIAPGGYAWLFPKSERSANVGLGIVALKSDGRNAREYLDEWIARRYAGGARTGYTVGGVIVHHTLKRTHTDGVMICGDAAHMVNPLSGGGIVNAMKSGRLAGRAAAAAI